MGGDSRQKSKGRKNENRKTAGGPSSGQGNQYDLTPGAWSCGAVTNKYLYQDQRVKLLKDSPGGLLPIIDHRLQAREAIERAKDEDRNVKCGLQLMIRPLSHREGRPVGGQRIVPYPSDRNG